MLSDRVWPGNLGAEEKLPDEVKPARGRQKKFTGQKLRS